MVFFFFGVVFSSMLECEGRGRNGQSPSKERHIGRRIYLLVGHSFPDETKFATEDKTWEGDEE